MLMQSGLNSDFTWSHTQVSAGGTSQVFLLIEWRAGVHKSTAVPVHFGQQFADEVQLHLQLGERVQLVQMYGCKGQLLNDRNLTLSLGSLSEGKPRQLGLEFRIGGRASGVYPLITALWTYWDVLKQKSVLQPSQTLPLQFSNHTSLNHRKANARVDKALRLLQNATVLDRARGELEKGNLAEGEGMIRRQADELLMHATRLRDTDYLEQADMLYKLSGLYIDTYRQSPGDVANT